MNDVTLSAVRNPANGHYYLWVPVSGITWHEAVAYAQTFYVEGAQGYLATLTTASEVQWVDETLFSGGRPDNTFLGGSDAAEEGTWRWVTGPEGAANAGAGTVFYQDGQWVGEAPTEWRQGALADPWDYLYIYSFFSPEFNYWNNSIGDPGSGGPAGILIEWGGFAPTGGVTISGTPTQGETLTADTSMLAGADGLGELSYQWLRDGQEIADATGASYDVTQADVGAEIRVVVSYTDGLGAPESVVSAGTGPIANVNDNPAGRIVLQVSEPASEFQVNTNTTGDQSTPHVVGLSDGGWFVTWQSPLGVYGQRYDLFGMRVGEEFQVNTSSDGSQVQPSLTSLSNGDLVFIWSSSSGFSSEILGQRFNQFGESIGDEFQVSSATQVLPIYPEIVALSDGGWVATWNDLGTESVVGRRFDVSGSPIGDEFVINSLSQGGPSFTAALPDGGWITTWRSYFVDGDGYGISGQRYDVAGQKIGNEFVVNTFASGNQVDANVTALSDGGWLVTWTSDGQDGSGAGIYGQRYDFSGVPVGLEFQINTYTYNSQQGPSVALLRDGGWVVTWMSSVQDGDDSGIFGQRYDIAGNPVGAEFAINSYVTGQQGRPSVAALDDGGWVVTWDSGGQDGDLGGIFGQRYDADGFTGAPTQGQTLTAHASALLDADGLGDLHYQWLRDGAEISEATGDSYELTQADVGAAMSVVVSYTDGLGTSESVTSSDTSEVVNVNDAPILTRMARSVYLAEGTMGGSPRLLDSSVDLTDLDGALGGGSLVVSGLLPEDVVSIANFGTGAGEIGVSGTDVTYGGQVIATISGGNGSDLVITFSAGISLEAAEALVEALAYGNSSGTPTQSRNLSLTIADGEGGTAGPHLVTVSMASTATDDILSGTENADLFFTGSGADINEGGGGDDEFRLSDTLTDAVWGSSRYTYAEQVTTSDGLRWTASLTGKVRVDDTFLGGKDHDTIFGSGLGEAVLLFDPNYSATNSALASFNARIIAVEAFDMGGGDDIVDLTSTGTQQGYIADAYINGGSGNDNLFAGGGNDTIVGGLGQDRIIGWRGSDVLTGGEEGASGDLVEDRFVFSLATAGGTDVITDFEDGIDRIYLLGFGAQSFAEATAGANPILQIDASGASTIVSLSGPGAHTRILLEGFSGTLDAADFVFFDDTASSDPDPGTNATPISGTAGDDQLQGTLQHDTFTIGIGADIVEGFAGDDRFVLGSDTDAIWEASRYTYAEQVTNSEGLRWSASLTGKIRVDETFLGGDGHDAIIGSDLGEAVLLFDPNYSGSNPILANFNARIIGVEEFDMGGGDDIVDLTSSADQQGFVADAKLLGGAGNDHLYSGAGNDTLIGGTGGDRLIGWRGDDILTGGGPDNLGDGWDDSFIFAFESGGGNDVITDFEIGIDRIIVGGYGAANYSDALASGALSIEQGATSTLLTLERDGEISTVELAGVTQALDQDHFVFYA